MKGRVMSLRNLGMMLKTRVKFPFGEVPATNIMALFHED